jgi:antitoxin ParD1/3/4/toxin ParE1/3/4
MAQAYEIASEAQDDLFQIWLRIAEDSVSLANRIERELYALFDSLAHMPNSGHQRRDLTNRPVLFFPLYSFLVVYRPDMKPILIMAVLRGRRDVKHILKERL